MKKIVTALLLGSLILTGCGQVEADVEDTQEEVFYVTTEKPEYTTFERKILLPGTLTPKDEGVITSKVSGVIEKVNKDVGDEVKSGQVLCEIEPETYARAYKKAEIALNNMTDTYNRTTELYEKEAVSRSEYESLRTQYDTLKEDYELAKLNLEYSKIKAPISGVISSKEVLIGQGVATGMELFRVVDISELYVETGVSEKDIKSIKEGQNVNIITEDGSLFEGKVHIIGPVPDGNTGAYPIKILIDNRQHILKAGMFVDLEVVYDVKENTMSINKDALIKENDAIFVFTASDKRAYKIEVEIGVTEGNRVEILSGVTEKDEIIISGHHDLNNSAKIKIVK